jgi:hypothetical protein
MKIIELQDLIRTYGYNVSVSYDRHGYHVSLTDAFGIGATCVHEDLVQAISRAHDTYQMAFREVREQQ